MPYLPISCSSSKKRGFSLVEAAVVLGVLGLVIGGIWAAAAAVRENLRVSEAISFMNRVSHGAMNLFSAYDIETLGNEYDVHETLIARGLIPPNWINGTNIVDPWGNTMVFKLVINDVTSPLPRIDMEFQNVSIKACRQLIAQAPRAGLLGVWVTLPSTTYYTSFPIPQSAPICTVVQPRLAFDYAPTRL